MIAKKKTAAGSVEFVRVDLGAYDAQLGINDVRYLLFAEQIRAQTGGSRLQIAPRKD